MRALIFALFVLCSSLAAHGEIVNRILATIDGGPVTLYELRQFVEGDVRARQLAGDSAATQLDALITERIIKLEISAQGIVVGDEDVDRYIETIRTRNALSEEQLRQALQAQGVTWEDYRKQVRDELQKAQLINREIRGKVNVTPEEVERYYQAHLEEYATPEEATVSHIVLRLSPDAPEDEAAAVMGRAEQIHVQLEGGANFEELAKQYSEDSAAKSGGKLGKLKKGEMLDEFEEVVMTLDEGEISRPFRTSVGVHIVRVEARHGASHQPLESLADEIKQRLYNAALEERYGRWLSEDLRKRHHVEIRP
jgi:peptidyl-prolyl cis-trans isomerase SurA